MVGSRGGHSVFALVEVHCGRRGLYTGATLRLKCGHVSYIFMGHENCLQARPVRAVTGGGVERCGHHGYDVHILSLDRALVAMPDMSATTDEPLSTLAEEK